LLSENQAFSLLKRRILLERGFDCEQYKENYLKRRIGIRVRATGASDYQDYLRILRYNPEEYAELLNELTINVTQFFRDADVYMKLQKSVLPDLVKDKLKMGSHTVRVWSAGCASGEEPYSMAMLMEKVLGADAKRWNVRVLGSDFDDGSLAIAREGVYRDIEMPQGIDAAQFFEITRDPDGVEFRLKEDIKRKVKFEKADLLGESKARRFDMILCRNLLIYFDRKVQTQIIETLSRSMLREGYLVLGKSETLGLEVAHKFEAVFPRERIYKMTADNRSEDA